VDIPDDLIGLIEAARLRRTSKQAVSALFDRGRLPVYVVGGRRLVSRRELLALTPGKPGRKPKQKGKH
jgi:hypothetical protein